MIDIKVPDEEKTEEKPKKDVAENANKVDLNDEPVIEVSVDGQQTFVTEG